MNFLEALGSGSPFKRKHWQQYFQIKGSRICSTDGFELVPVVEDLQANDFVLEPKKKELTRNDISAALDKLWLEDRHPSPTLDLHNSTDLIKFFEAIGI